MSSNTFKVVGITVHNGNAKVRFTDDMVRRVKQFTKGGATRCDFVELPNEMTKIEALKFMLTLPEYASAEDQATINDSISDREKDASKGTVKVKVSKEKAETATKTKTKPSVEAIKARAKKAETVQPVQPVTE
jgi:hypothetical protein